MLRRNASRAAVRPMHNAKRAAVRVVHNAKRVRQQLEVNANLEVRQAVNAITADWPQAANANKEIRRLVNAKQVALQGSNSTVPPHKS